VHSIFLSRTAGYMAALCFILSLAQAACHVSQGSLLTGFIDSTVMLVFRFDRISPLVIFSSTLFWNTRRTFVLKIFLGCTVVLWSLMLLRCPNGDISLTVGGYSIRYYVSLKRNGPYPVLIDRRYESTFSRSGRFPCSMRLFLWGSATSVSHRRIIVFPFSDSGFDN